jgi:hypothetical protein
MKKIKDSQIFEIRWNNVLSKSFPSRLPILSYYTMNVFVITYDNAIDADVNALKYMKPYQNIFLKRLPWIELQSWFSYANKCYMKLIIDFYHLFVKKMKTTIEC